MNAAAARTWLGCWRVARREDDLEVLLSERRGRRRLVLDDDFHPHEPGTDYSRCLEALAGRSCALVAFAGSEALAFGSEGHQAALVPTADGLVIAKWVAAPNEDHAAGALSRLPELSWTPTGVRWAVRGRAVVLHPAAERYEHEAAAVTAFGPGRFDVSWCQWSPDAQTSFELWALRSNTGR